MYLNMYKISLITGDGIGPELSESAISVLNTISDKFDFKFDLTKLSAGDKALEQTGKALPDDTVETIKRSDVCLKAPVGESAADVIVVLRRILDLYANIRPAKSCTDVSKEYPDIEFEQMYVDACAMNLIRQPEQFDVVVTTNLFGDILSDESSQVVGGLGMAPAANIGDNFALFEPVHGAAFDIAGQNIANPSSFLLSIKMMFDWLGAKHNDSKCFEIGTKLESTIFDLVKSGVKTKDIGGNATTVEFTKHITDNL